MPKLGVNIDHVATLRQARKGWEPDPLQAARICEQSGAHAIVAHLREDRRHINDSDITRLRKTVRTKFNLEMSLNPKIVKIAGRLKPDQATIVPERRQEITTEGGLDTIANSEKIEKVLGALRTKNIVVSLFVAPDKKHIKRCRDLGIEMIELHTGCYALAKTSSARRRELNQLKAMTELASRWGITVNAGHGLNYENTPAVARIPGIKELNIGHSIIARAVFVGLKKAVQDMVKLCEGK